MLSVEEAVRLVSEQTSTPRTIECATPESLGLILAETIASDVDSPPYDKSLVDGYAVLSSDIGTDGASLHVLEEVTAGAVPTRRVETGSATRIMTGAPLPEGADAVVMVEHTELESESIRDGGCGRVRIRATGARTGQNILRRGQAMRSGDVVLRSGRTIRGIEIGLLAELGKVRVRAYRRPSVAVLATGNELVAPDCEPQPGQIRNSNGWMLEALVRSAGANPVSLGVARDTREDLRDYLSRGLAADVLILSGGVSAGVLDLVPETLAELGVRQVFHKVHLRPGKPIWFGVRMRDGRMAPASGATSDNLKREDGDADATESGRAAACLVFGLPGNPVSSLVCFELFVRPALRRLRGERDVATCPDMNGVVGGSMRLAHAYTHRGDRPTFWPGVVEATTSDASASEATTSEASGAGWNVRLLNWQGSADLRTMCDADCLVHFPPGDRTYEAGSVVPVRWLN